MLGLKRKMFLSFSCISVNIISPGLVWFSKHGGPRLLFHASAFPGFATTSVFMTTGDKRGTSVYVPVDGNYVHVPCKRDYWLSRNLNNPAFILDEKSGAFQEDKIGFWGNPAISASDHISFKYQYLILTHEQKNNISKVPNRL